MQLFSIILIIIGLLLFVAGGAWLVRQIVKAPYGWEDDSFHYGRRR